MTFRPEHELHTRRRSRNLGLFIVLFGFVAVIFGLTVAKVRIEGETLTGSGTVQTETKAGVSE